MKLHLPQKFAAIILAALVSFTHASGTDFSDAALHLENFSEDSFSAAVQNGWTFTDITSSEDGTFTSTASQGIITCSTPWASVSDSGWLTLWSCIVTINVNSLDYPNRGVLIETAPNVSIVPSSRLEGIAYDASGNQSLMAAMRGTTWPKLTVTNELKNYADDEGLVTVGMVYKGDGGTSIYVGGTVASNNLMSSNKSEGKPAIFLGDHEGIQYRSLYLFGESVSDADMVRMLTSLRGSVTWTGSTDSNWDMQTPNWVTTGTENPDVFTMKTDAIFGVTAQSKTVNVVESVTAEAFIVDDDYTFNVISGADLRAESLIVSSDKRASFAGEGAITIGTLDGAMDIAEGTAVYTSNAITLTDSNTHLVSGKGKLVVTTLKVSGGAHTITNALEVTGGGDGMDATNRALGLAVTNSDANITLLGNTYITGALYNQMGTVNIGNGMDAVRVETNRVEFGDTLGNGASTLNVNKNATLHVRAGDVPSSYLQTGLVLGEWNGVSTANIAGKLYADNATAYVGDSTVTFNIEDGGIMAVKGFSQNKLEADKTETINLNMKNGGTLVLGANGITGQKPINVSIAGGEVGISAASVTIAKDIVLSGATTFNTDMYVWQGEDDTRELVASENGGMLIVFGNITGSGSITKIGTGTLVLAAANTFTSINLTAGTLKTTAAGALGGGPVTIAAGAMLDIQGANCITANTLNMMDGSTLSFTLGETNSTTAALTLTGTFNQSGALTINLADDGTVKGAKEYALLKMENDVTPGTWDITQITVAGLDASVSDLSWKSGTLYFKASPPLSTAIWSGEQSREWNFTDKNWKQEEIFYKYNDGVDVVFGDVGSGKVVLEDEVKPLSVLVENGAGHDYSIIGEGSLAGATSLTKRGESKLTIATANTFTGGTVVEGGMLVVGNSAALGTGGVEMSAGVLDLGGNTIANNVTTQGEVCITNGGIAGNVSMSNTVLEIAREVTIDGTITASSENLIAVDAGATLSISQTIANTGSYLEIAGAVDVSNIAGTKVGESSYIGGAVQGNGFEQSNMRIQVISNSQTSRYDISEASFIYKGAEVELDSTCAFNVGETDYTVFYVNSGTESLGTALDGAESAQVELAGVVMKSGTELTVDRNASTDLIQVKSGKATMNIAEGVTLSETNATRTDFILQGAGEYQLASGSTTLGAMLGDNWKGAVELVDVAVFEDFDLNKYGKAGSVVRMDGADVKLAPSNNVPFLPTLELTGDGMTITGCYAGETYIFAGGVIGDGDFVYNPTGLQHKQTYIFTGDVSQWTGAYESAANKTSTLKFDGNAVEMGAAIKATAGTVNVEVGNGTDAFATTFGNVITASSLKVLDKAAATLTKDTTIAGGIEVAGSLKIQGEGQLNVGDSVRMGSVDETTPATLAGVDISSSKLSARGEGKAELSGVSITTMEDFKLENVRLDGSFIDIGEDTTFYIKNVEISADTRITDGAAHMFIEGGKTFLDESNTEAAAPTMSLADVTFYRSGDTETWVTLHENVSLVSLTSELFTKVMLTGTDLWLDLTGLSAQVGDAAAFSVSFEDGALFDVESLRVYATLNGEKYLDGYTTQQSGGATTLYFSQQIPEPTTSTLSLLALATLVGRRKRRDKSIEMK